MAITTTTREQSLIQSTDTHIEISGCIAELISLDQDLDKIEAKYTI